jgi:uncharacterized protein (DUF983 family)
MPRLPVRTPPWWVAFHRGWRGACPHCGRGDLRRGVSFAESCPHCDTDLNRAEIGSAVALIAIPFGLIPAFAVVIAMEKWAPGPVWLETALAIGIALSIALGLMARVRGAVTGLAFANRVQGYHPDYAPDRDPAAQALGAPPPAYPAPSIRLIPKRASTTIPVAIPLNRAPPSADPT